MNATEVELKSVAKAIGASLKRAGHPVPHTAVLDAVASALNKRNWQTLHAAVGNKPSATIAPPTADQALRGYTGRTLMWLRLAYLAGVPVKELPGREPEALRRAQEALGASKSGLLQWGGWSMPADLEYETSKVDAGSFRPDVAATSGTLRLTFEKGQLVIEVGFTPADGWYVTKKGASDVFETLRRLVTDEDLLSAAPSRELLGPQVPAKFWTDDHAVEVIFDARPYLETASDKAINGIVSEGYGGSYQTDNIAEYICDKGLNRELQDGFSYLRARQRVSRETLGFECRVDGQAMLRWLHTHRPGMLAQLLCERHGVSLVEAQEDEIRGMWDWLDDQGNASDHASGTLEEAALNAMQVLGLFEQELTNTPTL